MLPKKCQWINAETQKFDLFFSPEQELINKQRNEKTQTKEKQYKTNSNTWTTTIKYRGEKWSTKPSKNLRYSKYTTIKQTKIVSKSKQQQQQQQQQQTAQQQNKQTQLRRPSKPKLLDLTKPVNKNNNENIEKPNQIKRSGTKWNQFKFK